MGFWNNTETLRQLSHGLMWGAVIFAVLAASATGLRFYVDRRVGELTGISQRARDDESRRRLEASESELQALRDQEKENQKRREISEKELAALKAKDTPRALSTENRNALVASLRSHTVATVVIKASINAPDARALAEQIAAALRSVGWTVRIDNAMFAGTDVSGVWITVRDGAHAPDGAGLLQASLKAAGLETRGQVDPAIDGTTGEFWLCIGAR